MVPGEPAATLSNLIASNGLFRAAIAACLVVTLLDVVVAWSLARAPTTRQRLGWRSLRR